MNDYVTAISALEMTRPRPRTNWTHRPYPRRRKRALGARIAALVKTAPASRPAPALS